MPDNCAGTMIRPPRIVTWKSFASPKEVDRIASNNYDQQIHVSMISPVLNGAPPCLFQFYWKIFDKKFTARLHFPVQYHVQKCSSDYNFHGDITSCNAKEYEDPQRYLFSFVWTEIIKSTILIVCFGRKIDNSKAKTAENNISIILPTAMTTVYVKPAREQCPALKHIYSKLARPRDFEWRMPCPQEEK